MNTTGSSGDWPNFPPEPDGMEMPAWFKLEITRGLEDLSVMRLRYRPTTEIERLETIKTVCEQLWYGRTWENAVDSPLLRKTFRTIADTMTEWPTPADILRIFQGFGVRPVAALPPQPELPILADEMGDFGYLIRKLIRVAPDNRAKVRVLGGVMSALFTQKYFGAAGKERLMREVEDGIAPFAEGR